MSYSTGKCLYYIYPIIFLFVVVCVLDRIGRNKKQTNKPTYTTKPRINMNMGDKRT